MSNSVQLRDVTEADLPIFFEQQSDPVACNMAAFTAREPMDRDAFAAKWNKILADESIAKRTIVAQGRVAGNIVCFVAPWSGQYEVSYWIGREFWGQGIATEALTTLLNSVRIRPLYARAAKDNIASIRVLEKCGFTISGYSSGFANARGAEVEEVILEFNAKPPVIVTLDRVADLSEADREGIHRLSLAVYPPEQMVNWPGRHVEWSKPDWCVRLRSEDGKLLSFVGVYVRDAACDGRSVRVGGIGNVKTHPQSRGQGLAAIGIRRAVEFFSAQPEIEFAVLVCEPQLIGYYARLGWQEFRGQLLVRQHEVPSEYTFSRVMTRSVHREAPDAGTIDLCGPPW
jgi:RimJ/RimL family protein N-acetyltransferase